jgi:hypothetical protein
VPLIAGPQLDALVSRVKKKRFASSYRESSNFVNPKTQRPVAARTVQRALHRGDLRSVRVRKCCFLTKAHREHRAWFANVYKGEDWANWVFSDEKWFRIGGVQGNEMSDPDPEERYVGKVAHPSKVMVWGAISFWGRSNLHFFSSKVNAAEYQNAVKEAMLDYLHDAEWMAVAEGAELTFMQDGARCHTAASTDQWLEENLPSGWRYTGQGGWPPNSPGHNPIELVWNMLQDKVIEHVAWTEDKLCEVIEEEWWKIPQSVIQDLYSKQADKMKLVLDRKGGRIPRVGHTSN